MDKNEMSLSKKKIDFSKRDKTVSKKGKDISQKNDQIRKYEVKKSNSYYTDNKVSYKNDDKSVSQKKNDSPKIIAESNRNKIINYYNSNNKFEESNLKDTDIPARNGGGIRYRDNESYQLKTKNTKFNFKTKEKTDQEKLPDKKKKLNRINKKVRKRGKAFYQPNENNDDNENYGEDQMNYNYKSEKKVVKTALKTIGAVGKCFVSAFTSLFGITAAIIGIAIISSVVLLQNVTYDFIVDDEKLLMDNVAVISSEFTDNISNYARENGCSIIEINGELTDWKTIISFWWILKENESKHKKYDSSLSGNDCDNLRKLFYQFNEVNYSISDTSKTVEDEQSQKKNEDPKKILTVSIVNHSVEELSQHWMLTSSERKRLNELLSDDAIWNALLTNDELSGIAHRELGQPQVKYTTWYPLEEGSPWNCAFLMYCLDKAGYLNSNYISKTNDIAQFKQQCVSKQWIISSDDVKIGDIAFLNYGGFDRVGVVSNVGKKDYSIILGEYDKTGIVKEIVVGNSSELIQGFARIKLPDGVKALKNTKVDMVKAGDCVWPAPGCYYVTSIYGPRNLYGTYHYGIDISCPEGTPIVASKSGTVYQSYSSTSAGEYIVLAHEDGTYTEYMHNSQRLVQAGETVTEGQIIAYSGNTGYSTGPHCHFGYRTGVDLSTREDPAPHLGITSTIGNKSAELGVE